MVPMKPASLSLSLVIVSLAGCLVVDGLAVDVTPASKTPSKCDLKLDCSTCLATNCSFLFCESDGKLSSCHEPTDTSGTGCAKSHVLSQCPTGPKPGSRAQGSTTTETSAIETSTSSTLATTAATESPLTTTRSTTPQVPQPTPSPQRASTPSSAVIPSRQNSGQGSRGFHGASFVGGMVMAFGLMAICLIAFNYHKARTERNYLTL